MTTLARIFRPGRFIATLFLNNDHTLEPSVDDPLQAKTGFPDFICETSSLQKFESYILFHAAFVRAL